jgi:UV DNA damage endonuclease
MGVRGRRTGNHARMLLGFAVKVLGPDGRGLPTSDARRPQNDPSLAVSLEHCTAALTWLARCDLRYWRLSSDLAPFATHPDRPQFHDPVARHTAELQAFGRLLAAARLRVSLHPSQYIVLGSPDPDVVARSIADLVIQAGILDALGVGPEGTVLLHAGGRYGDPDGTRARLLRTIDGLPDAVRCRLALENDDRLWDADEVLAICRQAELPMVLDVHHHRCLDRSRSDAGRDPAAEVERVAGLLTAAADTWPAGVAPEVHLSSGRLAPDDRAHADGVTDDDWRAFVAALDASGTDLAVMVEAKAKEHAVLALADRIRAGLLPAPRRHALPLPAWPADVAAAEPYASLVGAATP